MPNGSPGDDPIIDVISHGLRVYGEPIDSQLREISKLLSFRRLQDWFWPIRDLPRTELQTNVVRKLAELKRCARDRGWEV
jgi:hypothetical protein